MTKPDGSQRVGDAAVSDLGGAVNLQSRASQRAHVAGMSDSGGASLPLPSGNRREDGAAMSDSGGASLPQPSGNERAGGAAMITIGVAIPIPEPYGSALRVARLRFGDASAHAIPTHVTLLPPTQVSPDATGGIDEHLAKVASGEQPFHMLLRGTGTFRPVSPVVFIQVAVGLVECERIASEVRGGPLSTRQLSFPYHPHVTVAHDIAPTALDRAFDELSGYEASFDVCGFELYRHGSDGVWRPVQRFAFPDPEHRPEWDVSRSRADT